MSITGPARRGPLRVAVVGCQVGARHARTYRRLTDRYELVALCDTNAGRMEALAREIGGGMALEGDYPRLLQRGDLDLVSICTPPSLHLRQALEALAAGCHVVCEKPIVGSLHDLDVLQSAAARAGRRVVPVFQLRFGAGLQKLKHLVDRGLSGRCYLTTIETAWRRGADYYSTPWRRSRHGSLGGCLLGHAVHAHDMLCHIVGPVARVSAFARTLVNPIETEDCVSAALEMADGSVATLAVTLGSAREISRLRFCFERLVAESNTHPYEYSSEPWTFTGATPGIDREIADALAQFSPGPEGYEAQFAGLHEELCHGGAPLVTMDEARDAIELVTALYAASERGRIVEIPISRDDPAYRGEARPVPADNGNPAVRPPPVASVLR